MIVRVTCQEIIVSLPDLPGDAPEGKKEEVVKVEAVPPATTYFAHLKQ